MGRTNKNAEPGFYVVDQKELIAGFFFPVVYNSIANRLLFHKTNRTN
jgi:hypothetical protein